MFPTQAACPYKMRAQCPKLGRARGKDSIIILITTYNIYTQYVAMSPRHCGYPNELPHFPTTEFGPLVRRESSSQACRCWTGSEQKDRTTREASGGNSRAQVAWTTRDPQKIGSDGCCLPVPTKLRTQCRTVVACLSLQNSARSEQIPEFGMPSTQCSRKRHVDGEHCKRHDTAAQPRMMQS